MIYRLLISFAFLGCFLGCQPKKTTPQESLYSLQIGSTPAKVEIVVTPEEQRNGLMYRYELAKNEGMLFVYSNPKTMSFWMKNTIIPLSIAFIHRDGTISEIQKMAAYDGRPDLNLPRYVSKEEVPFALEMNLGWFEKNSIQPGDKVVLPKFLQVFFTATDIKNTRKIFDKISQADTIENKILAKKFPPEAFQDYQEKASKDMIIQVFNEIIVDDQFYQKKQFEGAPISAKAKSLLGYDTTPKEFLRNRALLESLFPEDIFLRLDRNNE